MEKTIPNKLFDDAMKNQLFTEQYANGLSKKIQNLLTAAQDEIAGKIAKIDPTSPSMTKWKQARLEKLNEEISGIIDNTYKTIATESKKQLTELGKVQSKLAVDKTNKAVKADIFKVTLTPDNVKSIVENTMIDGKVIGDWWANAKESTKTKLTAAMAAGTQALQIGMVQGESVGDLISRIRGTKTTPGIMSLTKREATALARTSVLQVANVTRQEVFKANEDVLDGIQFVATLDARTTPQCRAIDGKQYDMQGNPIGHNIPYPGAPPLHWQCRTAIVPITKPWSELAGPKSPLTLEQKASLSNIPVGLRSSMNGQVSGEMTYQDWLLTQSVEDQQAILGQGKWKLWSENKLDVADLVNNTGKELTLTELKANLGDILAKKQVELENQLKKLALESSSAEEFEKKLSENRSIKFLKDKTPSQFYADTKQTVEAARAARAEAKFLEQKAEESYKAIFLKNPKIAKEAEEQMMKASPGFEKLPWAEKEKLLNSFVDAMKSPAVEEIITKHEWISVQDIKEAKKIFKKQLNVNKVLAKQTAIKKLDFVGESLNIIKNLPRFSNQALPELQEFHMVVEFIDESVRRNVVAFYQEQEGIVKIATKGIKSEDVLELGRLSLAGDIGSVARHEFAHHIYSKSLTAIEQSEWGDLFEARYYWSNVSKYSVVNMKEAFAESFTAYTSPLYGTAENRILPEEVEEYFARVFGKVGTVKTEAIAEKIVEKEELALISEKVERAKKSHIPATKEVQKLADGNQTLVAIKIKGTETPDNAPFDIILGKDHIELKTIVRASNDKITMHPSSLKRKNDFVAGVKGGKAHTLVIDERTGKVYYRSGVGSFRLSSMEEIGVKENFEKRLLKRLKQKQV
ncbi:MAG: phage minor head protein [Sulfuricurvum sp.]|nr:phage minor head protein [Sulfuricurvum sp.]